jgi:hypothetical protein
MRDTNEQTSKEINCNVCYVGNSNAIRTENSYSGVSFAHADLVSRSARGEELFHVIYVHVDAWRGLLPAAAAHQHVACEEVAGVDHSRILLDLTTPLHRAIHLCQAAGQRGEHQVRSRNLKSSK